MTRKPEPKPWGFSAHVWQAWVFALAGLLALTNAAWFYTVRVTRVEAAAATPAPEPKRIERVIYQTADGRQVPTPYPTPAREPTPARVHREAAPREPLRADEQCIGGTRFRIRGDAWTSAGRC